ncbi:MAG: hypothetical protein J6K91_06010 [Opitutales bacterium]|nr:hypothetical protein [Opitutales bacterium]MBP3358450.1 hypothetical protein [Opitutales bacterium]
MKYFFENCNAVASIAMIFIATILLANGLELFAVWFLVIAVLIRTFTLEEVIKSKTKCQIIQFNEGSKLYVDDQTGLLAQAIAKHGIKNITKPNENDTTDVL